MQSKWRLKVLGWSILGSVLVVGRAAYSAEEVIVQVGTGDYGTALTNAYVLPFEKETGIDVIIVNEWSNANQLRLWHDNKTAEWDVTLSGAAMVKQAGKAGWLESIDYDAFEPELLSELYDEAKDKYGLAVVIFSDVMAYDPSAFAGQAPATWADFWNVQKFPAKRTLQSGGGAGGAGPWYFAALADGVAKDALLPLDIERAFASMERIKPHITKWWGNGSESQQLFADKLVEFGEVYNARVANLKKEGSNLEIVWNEGMLQIDFWTIPAYAKNKENAQKFIQFTQRADRQAVFAEAQPYSTSNKNMVNLVSPETAKMLPTHPDNMKNQFFRPYDWEAEVRPDGRTNLEVLIERWNQFILQ